MEIWNDNITREDLEIIPGVLNQELIMTLTLNTYLRHIEELIDMGISQEVGFVADHLEDVMYDIYLCKFHALEGRYPELEESRDHLRAPNSIFALHYFVNLCIQGTKEKWSEMVKNVRRNMTLIGY